MANLIDLCALTASAYDVAHEEKPDISEPDALKFVNQILVDEGYMLWAISQWREIELADTERLLTQHEMVVGRKLH